MSGTRDYHRPLVSGIQIKSGTGPFSIRTVGAGTLTGLATRNSDGKKMLVANLHVMAGEGDNGEYREPTGSEEMYQDLLTSDKRVGTNLVWVPIASGQSNVADVAMCELGDGVDANFILHDHPNHGSRKIIGGTVEPTEGMELTMLGASTGERMVTVADVGIARNLNGRDFTGLVKLNRRGGSIAWDGDSGAPCLFKVREGVYRIACIVFAANVLDPIAWAFPASVAEWELGITFGNRPPVVNARSVSQNRARNGSFEQGAWVGWRGLGNVNPGISTSAAKEGSRSLELTLPAGSSDLANPDIQHSSYDVPVTAGERWYAEAWVKGDYFRDGAYARVALFWYGQDGRRMAYELSPQYTAVSGSWDRLRVTGQAPAGARNVRVVVTLDGPAEASGHCWFDLVRLEQSITSVDAGDTVTLDGSCSSDPDRDALTYRWEQVFGSERLAIAERGITLSDNTAVAPTFTAPSNPRILTIKLTVTDLYGATATDTVKITVRATVPPAAPANLRATPSDRRVSLRWDYPDNTSITRYEYRLRLGANSWVDWTTVPSSGAATVGYVKVGLTNGTAYSFQTRAVNEHGAGQSVEAGPVTPTAPTPPDPPTPWRDTGSTRGCGPDKEKEQRRTSSGRRQTGGSPLPRLRRGAAGRARGGPVAAIRAARLRSRAPATATILRPGGLHTPSLRRGGRGLALGTRAAAVSGASRRRLGPAATATGRPDGSTIPCLRRGGLGSALETRAAAPRTGSPKRPAPAATATGRLDGSATRPRRRGDRGVGQGMSAMTGVSPWSKRSAPAATATDKPDGCPSSRA